MFKYSNTGYLVAGRQAEIFSDVGFNPSGTPELHHLFNEHFFQPLGMQNTVYQETNTTPSNLVEGLDQFPDGKIYNVTGVHPSLTNSAGALITNASDLHLFIHGLFNGKVVTTNSLNQMKTTVPDLSRPNVGYGLGFFVGPSIHGLSFNHTGSIPGYFSSWSYYPSLDASIIVFINTNTHPIAANSQTDAQALVEPLLLK